MVLGASNTLPAVEKPVTFFSAGTRLAGDLYVPDGPGPWPGVVLCCGYTGIKDLYLNDMGRRMSSAGYVALTFDYKGWGQSEGPRLRLAPYGRVEDTQAAMTFLGLQPEAIADRIGLYGISYGGSTATFAAAIDSRARAIVSVTGVGDGARWMRNVRYPWEYRDFIARGHRDWEEQVISGASTMAERAEVLKHDPRSAKIAAQARKNLKGAAMEVPLEFIHETLAFRPEWVVDRISPRAALFITSDADELVLPEESAALFSRAGEPRKLVTLKGYGHYEVFNRPAIDEVMAETIAWYERYL